jgi:hypothetical protein
MVAGAAGPGLERSRDWDFVGGCVLVGMVTPQRSTS